MIFFFRSGRCKWFDPYLHSNVVKQRANHKRQRDLTENSDPNGRCGMCFALSVWNVNQPAPRRAKSAMLPENASHAFTRSANPSHPISCRKHNCIFTISSPRLASPVHVFFSYSLSRATSICCVLTVLVKAEDGGRWRSPPGARGPVRLLGCRVSFVLLGALRSFRAAGLR